jgi:ribosomal protein S18 acetylase RimI-like enzyme
LSAGDRAITAITLAEWEHFVGMPQNRRGRDFLLALSPEGSLAGLATSSLRAHPEGSARHFRVLVDPALRRRGLGSALLGAITRFDKGAATLQTLCPEEWSAAAAFLTTMGFRAIDRELQMATSALSSVSLQSSGAWSISIETDIGAVAAEVAAIHNEAHCGTDAFVELDPAAMTKLLLSDGVLWVARTTGTVVGFCHLVPGEREVWLENLAVRPTWRRRGVGAALASAALGGADIGSERVARLDVSEHNHEARRLYERLGFRREHSSTRFRASREKVAAAMLKRR